MQVNEEHLQTVRRILENETRGNLEAAFKKLDPDYSMTWVYRHPKTGELFPSARISKTQMRDVYDIQGKRYDIKHMAETDGVVFVELLESYPDPDTGKMYRTPLVLVLEMKEGKIKTGRHYCDPHLSYEWLSNEQVKKAYNK